MNMTTIYTDNVKLTMQNIKNIIILNPFAHNRARKIFQRHAGGVMQLKGV